MESGVSGAKWWLSIWGRRDPGWEVEQDRASAVLSELTPRQQLVCVWKLAGFSNDEIANYLGCSARSVEEDFSRAIATVRRTLDADRRRAR